MICWQAFSTLALLLLLRLGADAQDKLPPPRYRQRDDDIAELRKFVNPSEHLYIRACCDCSCCCLLRYFLSAWLWGSCCKMLEVLLDGGSSKMCCKDAECVVRGSIQWRCCGRMMMMCSKGVTQHVCLQVVSGWSCQTTRSMLSWWPSSPTGTCRCGRRRWTWTAHPNRSGVTRAVAVWTLARPTLFLPAPAVSGCVGGWVTGVGKGQLQLACKHFMFF